MDRTFYSGTEEISIPGIVVFTPEHLRIMARWHTIQNKLNSVESAAYRAYTVQNLDEDGLIVEARDIGDLVRKIKFLPVLDDQVRIMMVGLLVWNLCLINVCCRVQFSTCMVIDS